MAFRYKLLVLLVVMLTINIAEFECSKTKTKGNEHRKRTLVTQATTSSMDFGVSAVVDNASYVFRKLISKMIANKKLVGLDSGWYL